jgi:hypothetical protein
MTTCDHEPKGIFHVASYMKATFGPSCSSVIPPGEEESGSFVYLPQLVPSPHQGVFSMSTRPRYGPWVQIILMIETC